MANLPRIWEEPFKLMSNVGRMLDIDEDFGFKPGYGRTDVYEKGGQLHYNMELPGLKKDDITARVENNTLIVKGEIKKDESVKDNNYLRMERRYGQFQKTFPLPDAAKEVDNVKAKFEDGILKIAIPLKESIRGEVVDIKID